MASSIPFVIPILQMKKLLRETKFIHLENNQDLKLESLFFSHHAVVRRGWAKFCGAWSSKIWGPLFEEQIRKRQQKVKMKPRVLKGCCADEGPEIWGSLAAWYSSLPTLMLLSLLYRWGTEVQRRNTSWGVRFMNGQAGTSSQSSSFVWHHGCTWK